MEAEKLETFVDAVLAIILTIIVLELPQPETISFAGFWALKTNFFAYLTSFIIVLTNWYFFHIIFEIIKKLDAKVITMTGLLVFIMSLLPYFTLLISNNFTNLNAQIIYCIYFNVVGISYDVLFWSVSKSKHNKNLRKLFNIKRTIIYILVSIIGILLGIFINPMLIIMVVFLSVLYWFIHVYLSIKDI